MMLDSGMSAQIAVGDRTSRTDRDYDEPDAKEPEENPESRAANSIEQPYNPGALLVGAFEENRAERGDARVYHESEDRSGANRDEEIGSAQERTQKREEHAPTEKRDRICRTQ